ncbi:UNVERIFIED_CONTAM: hypothetical protein DES50_11484 [Williamsia faeni]
MAVAADPISAALDCAAGPCPGWVSAVFAQMYPDDALALPTQSAVTVLACDDDWEWIAHHAAAVAGAVDGVCTAVSGAGAGEWVVASGVVEGHAYVVCTAANSASVVAGVGNVVLVLRPVTTGLPADSFTLMSR